MPALFPKIEQHLKEFQYAEAPAHLSDAIRMLSEYVRKKIDENEPLRLNFICTHNSRRSQMAQAWAEAIAYHFDIPIETASGGVEVTAFHPNAIKALQECGFQITTSAEEQNPRQYLQVGPEHGGIPMFSKLYDDAVNPQRNFAAVMTCSDADENCPFIPGADVRIPLRFEDPKSSDGTGDSGRIYLERSLGIGNALFKAFRNGLK